jgi:hypothetical protein
MIAGKTSAQIMRVSRSGERVQATWPVHVLQAAIDEAAALSVATDAALDGFLFCLDDAHGSVYVLSVA